MSKVLLPQCGTEHQNKEQGTPLPSQGQRFTYFLFLKGYAHKSQGYQYLNWKTLTLCSSQHDLNMLIIIHQNYHMSKKLKNVLTFFSGFPRRGYVRLDERPTICTKIEWPATSSGKEDFSMTKEKEVSHILITVYFRLHRNLNQKALNNSPPRTHFQNRSHT